MDYTQLINLTLRRLELQESDVSIVSINLASRTITVLTTWYAKFVGDFPQIEAEPDDFNQDPQPRPKRITKIRAVKTDEL